LIRELLNAKHELALTSDRWHVVHARWSGQPGVPSFERSIVSEHEDSSAALRAGRALKSSLRPSMASRSRQSRDQVLVRRPSAESIKTCGRVRQRRNK